MRPTGHMTTAQESGSLSGKPRRGNHAQPSCVNQVSVGALMLYPGAATAWCFQSKGYFPLKTNLFIAVNKLHSITLLERRIQSFVSYIYGSCTMYMYGCMSLKWE